MGRGSLGPPAYVITFAFTGNSRAKGSPGVIFGRESAERKRKRPAGSGTMSRMRFPPFEEHNGAAVERGDCTSRSGQIKVGLRAAVHPDLRLAEFARASPCVPRSLCRTTHTYRPHLSCLQAFADRNRLLNVSQPQGAWHIDVSSISHFLHVALTLRAMQACMMCGITETPLWRANDIDGEKNLCNACGVRQNRLKRARRMADAAQHSICQKGHAERQREGSSASPTMAKRAASVSCHADIQC